MVRIRRNISQAERALAIGGGRLGIVGEPIENRHGGIGQDGAGRVGYSSIDRPRIAKPLSPNWIGSKGTES